MKKYSLLTITLILTACSEPEVIRDVDYYLANADERAAKLEYCEKSVERMDEVNCQNAHSAKSKETIRKMFNEGIPRSNPNNKQN